MIQMNVSSSNKQIKRCHRSAHVVNECYLYCLLQTKGIIIIIIIIIMIIIILIIIIIMIIIMIMINRITTKQCIALDAYTCIFIYTTELQSV